MADNFIPAELLRTADVSSRFYLMAKGKFSDRETGLVRTRNVDGTERYHEYEPLPLVRRIVEKRDMHGCCLDTTVIGCVGFNTFYVIASSLRAARLGFNHAWHADCSGPWAIARRRPARAEGLA
ncbi:MAG: hypothetical protein JW719_08830 [Pirellulales bacterium]|nr:hypothetical protein [Pirellulales bacterium]